MDQKILDKLEMNSTQVEDLSVVDLACLLSHLCVWQQCIDVVLFNRIMHPKLKKVYQTAVVTYDKLFSEVDVKFSSSIIRNKKKNNPISFNVKTNREFSRAISSLRMKTIDFK